MKKSIVIFWLFFSLTASGQPPIDHCESGIRTARERLAKGQIYFPRHIFDSGETLRKILEQDYGILDRLYSEYCVSFGQEEKCHDSLMMKAIADKWGDDFLVKQRELANRLVREGKGYKTPSSVENEKAIDQLMRKGYKDNGIVLKRFEIDLVISSKGKILKHEIHSLSEGKVTPKEIEIINNAIAKYSDNWTPGELKGIPQQMDTYIQIGKWVTLPPE
jgi:hypothetical protein